MKKTKFLMRPIVNIFQEIFKDVEYLVHEWSEI